MVCAEFIPAFYVLYNNYAKQHTLGNFLYFCSFQVAKQRNLTTRAINCNLTNIQLWGWKRVVVCVCLSGILSVFSREIVCNGVVQLILID